MKKSEYLYTTQDASFDHHELSMTIIAPLVSFVMLKMHGDFQTITAANIELHSYHFAVPCLGNPLSVLGIILMDETFLGLVLASD